MTGLRGCGGGTWSAGDPAEATPWAAAGDLVLPRTCAVCREPAVLVCSACAADLADSAWSPGPTWTVPDPIPRGCPPTVSWGTWSPASSAVVRAYKDGDRRDLARLLAPLLRGALEVGLLAFDGRPALGAADRLAAGETPLVVPVPSSRDARRRRGDRPLGALAVRATAGLGLACDGDAVKVARPTRDQAGLRAGERVANLAGAIGVTRRGADAVAGRDVLVVDDVVTTGATLTACADAVRQAGAARVVAATIFAARRQR